MSKLQELIKELCPEGVEFRKLGEVCEYIRGITYNKSQEAKPNDINTIKVLRANNISVSTNTLNFSDIKEVISTVKYKKEQKLYKGDILICAGSGSKEHIGKVAYIFNDIDYTFGGFMAVVRCSPNITSRFLFHILTSKSFNDYLNKTIDSSTINNLNSRIMGNFEIPLPPLEIQNEIVRILDAFTAHTAELQAELQARKEQYEYYRNKLFTFDENDEGVKWMKLNEFAEIGTGSSNTQDELSDGLYPFFVRSQIVRSKNEYEFDETAIITSGDGVGVGKIFHYVEGKYALHQRAYRIHILDNTVMPKFFFYYMRSEFYNYITKNAFSSSVTSIRKPMLLNFPVPLPPLSEQQRIVSILDKFESLVNDLSEGLPAEIAAVQEQYEYYRNKLLTFKRKS